MKTHFVNSHTLDYALCQGTYKTRIKHTDKPDEVTCERCLKIIKGEVKSSLGTTQFQRF